MKKLLLKTIATMLVVNVGLNAIEPKWNLNGLALYGPKEATSKATPKDVIFIVSSNACSHCKSFNNELSNLSVEAKRFINSNYITTVVNVQDAPQIAQIFKVEKTPSIFILDKKTKKFIADSLSGEPEINEFVDYLVEIARARRGR